MVTTDTKNAVNHKAIFTFYGLSTDTKPVGQYEHVDILNGSCFFEMDTQDVKFYNAASETWV